MTSINNYFTLKITKDKRKIGQKIKDRCTVKKRVGRDYINFSENLFVFKIKFWTAKEIFIFV